MSKFDDIFQSLPNELCFDKNDFMMKSFSVDKFLQEHRNVGSLEIIRDDLGLYLKVLRTSMIELINNDYADFVNLSANLIDLDKKIMTINNPLNKLYDDINTIKLILKETMDEIDQNLSNKNALRLEYKNILYLKNVILSKNKLNNILIENINEKKLNINLLERTSYEIIQLKFNQDSCKHLITNEINIEINNLYNNLLKLLKINFLNSLTTNNEQNLEIILRIYLTLNECNLCEEIYKLEMIRPFLEKLINEKLLQTNENGLNYIFNEIFQFIEKTMKLILKLTKYGKINGYNFLINSLWSDIVYLFNKNITSIYAPGNPDVFFNKYMITMNFLNKFQLIINDNNAINIINLQQQAEYKQFLSRWNLPVYFQIRFQEIGGSLETICNQEIDKNYLQILINDETAIKNDALKLKQLKTLIETIIKIWSPGVYIKKLFINFFKLTLQVLSRANQWLKLTIKNYKDMNINLNNDYNYLLMVYFDINHLDKELKCLFETKILVDNIVPEEFQKNYHLIQNSLNEAKINILANQNLIKELIEIIIYEKVINFIKNINDIPRLYRKTKRDLPTKSLNYIDSILNEIHIFIKCYQLYNYNHDLDENLNDILYEILSKTTEEYYSAVDDVLTSVQKTEESLKRLKNLRDNTINKTAIGSNNQLAASGNGGGNTAAITDDDKIRLQLNIDINKWFNEIELMHLDKNKIMKLNDLLLLIDNSINKK